jgi:serine protease AprX
MAETGIVLISKIDPDTGGLISESFPIIDVIPSEYVFGYTGLSFEPKKFYWDFGDGTNSDIPKPKHTYRTYGYHKVIFSIMNNGNDWYKIDDIDSHLVVLGKMDFSGEPLRGEKPLLVYLDDNSLAPTGYQYTGMQWDLGDTHGATGRSISHNYLDYGSYTVGINMTLDKI